MTTSSRAMRWITSLATIVLLVAIAIGAAIVVAWSSLPLDHATLVVDGETVALPSLSGWQAAMALLLAVFAVLVAAIVVVGAVAIAVATALSRHRHRRARDRGHAAPGRLAGADRRLADLAACPRPVGRRSASRTCVASGCHEHSRTLFPTAVIADDERLLREQLRARLAEVWPELEIVGEAKNGTEAVRAGRASTIPTWSSSTSACRA